MGEARFEGGAREQTVIVGHSEVSFDDALQAAVVQAVESKVASVGDVMIVLQQAVTIANPKIGEYRIAITPGR
jgi:flavin-binding protein dodecin